MEQFEDTKLAFELTPDVSSLDTVKMFDYWAFHNNGSVQFFQICEGVLTDYREYEREEDAPVTIINERSFNPNFVGPTRELRYHGRSYVAPVVGGLGNE